MADVVAIDRAAAALRTALVGEKMLRFDAPRLVGMPPVAGRTIEGVRCRGRHVEVIFDDDLVLHTHLRMAAAWHVYRSDERWRKGYRHLRASIETNNWIAVCFDAPTVETYQVPDRRRHPGMGCLGPNLCRTEPDLFEALARLSRYPRADAPIADVLADQRVMHGLGNVYRSEALWACELSPWAPVGALTYDEAAVLVETAAHLVYVNLRTAERVTTVDIDGGLAVYGRSKQLCVRCGSIVEATPAFGPSDADGDYRPHELPRDVYWCPGCQTRHEPAAPHERAMDPHPAAVQYLNDLPWRRQRRSDDAEPWDNTPAESLTRPHE